MTLVEITYQLQTALKPEQLARLASFANTYGLRKFRLAEEDRLLTFEYDASRLKETHVRQALGQAGIAILRRVEPASASADTQG